MQNEDVNREAGQDALAQLLFAAASPLDRLPGLASAVVDYATQFSAELRARDGIDVIVTPRESIAANIAEFSDSEAKFAGVPLEVPDWETKIAIGMSHDLIFSAVEAVFGGDGTMPASDINRAPSHLELKVATHFIGHALTAFKKSFSRTGGLILRAGDIKANLGEIEFGRKNTSVVLVRLDVEIIGRVGEIVLVLPKNALEGLRRDGLPGDHSGGDHDPVWETQFTRELQRADVKLRAVIRDRSLMLGDIAKLEVGSLLPLEADANANVYLEANDEAVFVCSMGQADGRYTVRLRDNFDKTRDLMDEIVGR